MNRSLQFGRKRAGVVVVIDVVGRRGRRQPAPADQRPDMAPVVPAQLATDRERLPYVTHADARHPSEVAIGDPTATHGIEVLDGDMALGIAVEGDPVVAVVRQ